MILGSLGYHYRSSNGPVTILAGLDEDAQVLAGSSSIIPALNLPTAVLEHSADADGMLALFPVLHLICPL